MKTEVIVKRELFGCDIQQKSKSGYFCVNDLVKAGNKYRLLNDLPLFQLSQYLKGQSVQEFIKSLEIETQEVVIKAGRGRNAQTWVHPFLFIDIAFAINPTLKVKAIKFIYDDLLKFRNESGVSYKKMCGALYQKYTRKSEFHKYIDKVAKKIKLACETNDWNGGKEELLKLRDKIHNNITLLADVLINTDDAVDIGIQKAIEEHSKNTLTIR